MNAITKMHIEVLRRHAEYIEVKYPTTAWTMRRIAADLDKPDDTSVTNSSLVQAVLDRVVGTNLGIFLTSAVDHIEKGGTVASAEVELTDGTKVELRMFRVGSASKEPLRPGELAQLRRIDRTARALAESIAEWNSYPPFVALQEALYDGRLPEEPGNNT